jgi:phage gpG-like protein
MARKKRTWYYKNSPNGASASWPILQWTWNLKSSLFQETGDLYALVWNSAPYFKYHQTKKTSWSLPRRVILEIRETNKLKIQMAIWKGINKRVWNFWKQF